MAVASRSNLKNFFIFNTDYGQKEGHEEEKTMLYIPQEEDIDTKIKNIGLSEALVKFCETFNPRKPCEVLHSQKSRQVFLNPEGQFWMVMTLIIPFNEKTLRDGKKVLEYHEEDVQDPILKAVLMQAYDMFKLFNGEFKSISDKYGLEPLKDRLQYFYSRYLQTLNFGQSDILDVCNGISFLPLDKTTFLKVQCFTNVVEATFSPVEHTCFLQGDQLLWTTLEQNDMKILYKYISTSLFPAAFETDSTDKEGQKSQSLGNSSPSLTTQNLIPGRFLTVPSEIGNSFPLPPKRAPKVFVNVNNEVKELYLIVYKAVNAVICLMVTSQPAPTIEFYHKLRTFLGPQLAHLSNVITDQTLKRFPLLSDQQYRFLYFNQMNLAIKSSIHAKKSSQVTGVTPEMMRLLVDIHGDFDKVDQDGEMIMKNLSDCWIVARRSDRREFFVILNQKNANLVEINEEVKRLVSSSFNNIFFVD